MSQDWGSGLLWSIDHNTPPRTCAGTSRLFVRALPFELLRVQLLQPAVRVRVSGALVVPDPRDPCEPEGEARLVVRAPLNLVVRDLHDDLGPHVDDPRLLRGLHGNEPLHQVEALLVREPLERLPDHLPPVAVPDSEPVVAQRPLAPSVSPFGGENRDVQGVRGFDLEPFLPALPDGVWGVELFRHEALVAGVQGLPQERLDLCAAPGDDPVREEVRRDEPLEGRPPRPIRSGDQGPPVEVDYVEEVEPQG